jgi:hypothetical protein
VDRRQASTLRSVILIARIAASRVVTSGLSDGDLAAIAGDVLRGRGFSVSDTDLHCGLSSETEEKA